GGYIACAYRWKDTILQLPEGVLDHRHTIYILSQDLVLRHTVSLPRVVCSSTPDQDQCPGIVGLGVCADETIMVVGDNGTGWMLVYSEIDDAVTLHPTVGEFSLADSLQPGEGVRVCGADVTGQGMVCVGDRGTVLTVRYSMGTDTSDPSAPSHASPGTPYTGHRAEAEAPQKGGPSIDVEVLPLPPLPERRVTSLTVHLGLGLTLLAVEGVLLIHDRGLYPSPPDSVLSVFTEGDGGRGRERERGPVPVGRADPREREVLWREVPLLSLGIPGGVAPDASGSLGYRGLDNDGMGEAEGETYAETETEGDVPGGPSPQVGGGVVGCMGMCYTHGQGQTGRAGGARAGGARVEVVLGLRAPVGAMGMVHIPDLRGDAARERERDRAERGRGRDREREREADRLASLSLPTPTHYPLGSAPTSVACLRGVCHCVLAKGGAHTAMVNNQEGGLVEVVSGLKRRRNNAFVLGEVDCVRYLSVRTLREGREHIQQVFAHPSPPMLSLFLGTSLSSPVRTLHTAHTLYRNDSPDAAQLLQ
ncbi:hypothetical protein KIPB_010275, partial [Kipferlia bialata]